MEKDPEPKTPPSAPASQVSGRSTSPWLKACCGCLLAVVIVGGAIMIWVLWLFAATGFMPVPLLSRWAYRTPEPMRVVAVEAAVKLPFDPAALEKFQGLSDSGEQPSEEELEALQSQFEDLLDEDALKDMFAQFEKLGGAVSSRGFSFDLTEGMLTGTIRQSAALPKSDSSEKDPSPFDTAHAQIAISEAKGMELFLPLKDNAQHSALRAYLVPSVTADGRFDLAVREVWLGNMKVPNWVTNPMSDGVFRKILASLTPELAKYVILKKLEVQNGSVLLEGTFTDDFQAL